MCRLLGGMQRLSSAECSRGESFRKLEGLKRSHGKSFTLELPRGTAADGTVLDADVAGETPFELVNAGAAPAGADDAHGGARSSHHGEGGGYFMRAPDARS